MLRLLPQLLDEWIPVLAGVEINDDPIAPMTNGGKRIVAEQKDDAKIEWVHRSDRYHEKLATPDVTIADLIGEIDLVKHAEGRYLSDESTMPLVVAGSKAVSASASPSASVALAMKLAIGMGNVCDGVLVADVAEAGGANASFLHSGLTNGTTYYYSAFTYDTAENYSSTAHAQATPANVSITSLTPKLGNAGTAVVISGSGFGNLQATSTVSFNGVSAAVSAWSDTSISTSVPTQAATGPVIVTVNGVTSNQVIFRVGEKLEAPERFRRK